MRSEARSASSAAAATREGERAPQLEDLSNCWGTGAIDIPRVAAEDTVAPNHHLHWCLPPLCPRHTPTYVTTRAQSRRVT